MSTATHPIDEGALVRLVRDTDNGWQAGVEFIVAEYLEPRPASERASHDEIDAPVYYGNYGGGYNNVCVPADAVELVKTAAAMKARRAPTVQEVRNGVASELCGYLGYDGMEINETVRCGQDDDEIEAYGVTADGLPFAVRLRVLGTWETDL